MLEILDILDILDRIFEFNILVYESKNNIWFQFEDFFLYKSHTWRHDAHYYLSNYNKTFCKYLSSFLSNVQFCS